MFNIKASNVFSVSKQLHDKSALLSRQSLRFLPLKAICLVLSVMCISLPLEAMTITMTNQARANGPLIRVNSINALKNRIGSTSLKANTIIRFQSGQTFDGSLVIGGAGIKTSGKLTITTSGPGRATLRTAGKASVIKIVNKSNITIKNLNFRTKAGVNIGGAAGIELSGTTKAFKNNIRIEFCSIQGYSHGVVASAFGKDVKGFNNLRIQNVVANGNVEAGIGVFANTVGTHQNVNIVRCTANGNTGNNSNSNRNSGSGIVIGGVSQGTITNSTASNNGARSNMGNEGPVGIWAYNSDRILISRNRSTNNKTRGVDGGGFDLDNNVTNSKMQLNVSRGNAGPGYLIFDGDGATRRNSNNVVEYNYSESDGRKNGYGGITVGGAVTGCIVRFNVVKMGQASPAASALSIGSFGSGSPGVSVTGNQFATAGNAVAFDRGNVANANVRNNTYPTGRGYTSIGLPSNVDTASIAAFKRKYGL